MLEEVVKDLLDLEGELSPDGLRQHYEFTRKQIYGNARESIGLPRRFPEPEKEF